LLLRLIGPIYFRSTRVHVQTKYIGTTVQVGTARYSSRSDFTDQMHNQTHEPVVRHPYVLATIGPHSSWMHGQDGLRIGDDVYKA